jgi:SAM-dependent methyltransferase
MTSRLTPDGLPPTDDPTSDDLVPPVELLFDGTTSVDEFKSVGEGFVRHFVIERAGLKPNGRVLDVGCGIGQKARPLTRYLDPTGGYDGFDVVPEGIHWCQAHYAAFGNFHFQLADIFNTHYNREGRWKADEYTFPYEPASFDVVFLSSVFTHLLPRAVENYLREISRVLVPGGRCAITFFLLNRESRRGIEEGRNSIAFPHAESRQCRVADAASPETAVAYDEGFARELHDRFGLRAAEISYGSWCGREELYGCYQDAIISLKERSRTTPLVNRIRAMGASVKKGLGWGGGRM